MTDILTTFRDSTTLTLRFRNGNCAQRFISKYSRGYLDTVQLLCTDGEVRDIHIPSIRRLDFILKLPRRSHFPSGMTQNEYNNAVLYHWYARCRRDHDWNIAGALSELVYDEMLKEGLVLPTTNLVQIHLSDKAIKLLEFEYNPANAVKVLARVIFTDTLEHAEIEELIFSIALEEILENEPTNDTPQIRAAISALYKVYQEE